DRQVHHPRGRGNFSAVKGDQMLRGLLVSGAVVVLLAGPARAALNSGNEWLEQCTAGKNSTDTRKQAEYLMCFAYTRGLFDGMLATSHGLEEINGMRGVRLSCPIGGGVTTGQLVDIGINYMRRHANARHLPAGLLLSLAFREAWP